MSDIQPKEDGTCSRKCPEWYGKSKNGMCLETKQRPPEFNICPVLFQRQREEIERLRGQLNDCQEVNASVSVCADHTSEITTFDGCYVCEIERLREYIRKYVGATRYRWLSHVFRPERRYDDSPEQQEIERLSNLLWGARCVFCGGIIGEDRRNQEISDTDLRKHVEICPDHPLFHARAEIERLQERIRSLEAAIQIYKGGLDPVAIAKEDQLLRERVKRLEAGLRDIASEPSHPDDHPSPAVLRRLARRCLEGR